MPGKLYVPAIGDQLTLTLPWAFDLFNEYRNETLVRHLAELGTIRAFEKGQTSKDSVRAALPVGSVLQVDRIYIRKGAAEFSSMSFLLVGAKTTPTVKTRTATAVVDGGRGPSIDYEEKVPARPVRFWAKLADCNNINFA